MTICCSSSSVFMTNKTPNGTRKHRESTQPESSKTAKLFFFFFFFFFFFLSSDGLAQYSVNLSRWFTHETTAFSTEQCTTQSLFHNFDASQGARSHSLKQLPIWDAIFFICTYACALKDHLATTRNCYTRLLI